MLKIEGFLLGHTIESYEENMDISIANARNHLALKFCMFFPHRMILY